MKCCHQRQFTEPTDHDSFIQLWNSVGESEDFESATSEDTPQGDGVAPASRLEVKTVYEVYVSSRVQVLFTANKLIFIQLGLRGA